MGESFSRPAKRRQLTPFNIEFQKIYLDPTAEFFIEADETHDGITFIVQDGVALLCLRAIDR